MLLYVNMIDIAYLGHFVLVIKEYPQVSLGPSGKRSSSTIQVPYRHGRDMDGR